MTYNIMLVKKKQQQQQNARTHFQTRPARGLGGSAPGLGTPSPVARGHRREAGAEGQRKLRNDAGARPGQQSRATLTLGRLGRQQSLGLASTERAKGITCPRPYPTPTPGHRPVLPFSTLLCWEWAATSSCSGRGHCL